MSTCSVFEKNSIKLQACPKMMKTHDNCCKHKNRYVTCPISAHAKIIKMNISDDNWCEICHVTDKHTLRSRKRTNITIKSITVMFLPLFLFLLSYLCYLFIFTSLDNEDIP